MCIIFARQQFVDADGTVSFWAGGAQCGVRRVGETVEARLWPGETVEARLWPCHNLALTVSDEAIIWP